MAGLDVTGMKVIHKAFGEGTVKTLSDGYITVQFATGEKMFTYPKAFDGFLSTDDPALLSDLEEWKRIEVKKKARREEEARLAELRRQEEKARREELARAAAEARMKSAPAERTRAEKTERRKNVAFKCNYNNGGRNAKRIGFCGVYSDEIIWNNIEVEKRTWCNQPQCKCQQYYQGKLTRQMLEDAYKAREAVCSESNILVDWRMFAGWHHNGPRKNLPMKLLFAEKNRLAVLTTRFPGEEEKNRLIFAVYLIDDAYQGDDKIDGFVAAGAEYRLCFSLEESRKLLFWNYFRNANDAARPAWSSGLHRYLSDTEAVQILRDAAEVKRGTADEKPAADFLKHYCEVHRIDAESVPEPKGALKL